MLIPFGILSSLAQFSLEYLVIAGGAGGGGAQADGDGAGAGGAGGYRSSVVGQNSGGGSSAETQPTISVGEEYLVTVGAGGAGGAVTPTRGTNGSNSIFSTITNFFTKKL